MYFIHNGTKVGMRPDYVLPTELGGDGFKTVAEDLGYSNEQVPTLCLEFDTNVARELRRGSYPSIADQLDTLYHGGYDARRAQIEAVKTQFPKPEETA